jgi:type III pantothenate kinase
MTGPIVVDVGNTRIKWGRCEHGQVTEVAALPPDALDAWERQCAHWPGALACRWIVSGVHPARRDALVRWLRSHQATVHVLESHRQLPLVVQVPAPEQVGIDRLLNAVAANTRRPEQTAAVVVDAGSAVTVDYVDPAGAFRGGAIFPGLRLMAKALHDYTAALPLVEIDCAAPPPGTSTVQAIRTGVYHAVLGGIHALIERYREGSGSDLTVFVTGGDGPLLSTGPQSTCELWPEMTLCGILHSKPEASRHG